MPPKKNQLPPPMPIKKKASHSSIHVTDAAVKPPQTFSYRLDQGVLKNKTQDHFATEKKQDDRRMNSKTSIVNNRKPYSL